MDEFENWVNTNEAARLTGYEAATIRYLARHGRVKARKISRDWFVEKNSLIGYKSKMDRLGSQKHNPWRDDLAEAERGRNSKQLEEENAVTSD